MTRRILLALCALCILLSLTLQVLASAALDPLLELAEQEPETAGAELWKELQEEPEAFLAWLKEKDTNQRNTVFSAMEQAVPSEDTALIALYAVYPKTEDRADLFRLALMLEKNMDAPVIYEDYGRLLEKALYADGAYTEVCLRQLAKALQDDPEAFAASMAERTEEEQAVLTVLVQEGLRFYAPDYDLEAQQPVTPPQEETTVPQTTPVEETQAAGTKPAETAVQGSEKQNEDSGKPAIWWLLIPVGLALAAAVVWYRKKKQ